MDALSTMVTLLKPQALGVKIIHGAGRWGVRYPAHGQPGFALVLEGSCWLAVDGAAPMTLEAGDFVLFPAMPAFTMASDPKVKAGLVKLPAAGEQEVDEIHHGEPGEEPSVSMVGGYFAFDPLNARILLDLLPGVLRIRAADPGDGLARIVGHLRREAGERRPGRALVLNHLVEIMLVEALRCEPAAPGSAGLLAGLGDARLAAALHGIHTRTAEPWTLATLAREAGMSRSSFAERFLRVIGKTPVNYLLQWRLAVAKDLMARRGMSVGEAALAVGYESASGFSTAFSRETGRPPRDFIRPR